MPRQEAQVGRINILIGRRGQPCTTAIRTFTSFGSSANRLLLVFGNKCVIRCPGVNCKCVRRNAGAACANGRLKRGACNSSESDCTCDQGFATNRRSAYQYACADLANSALPDIRLLTAMTASLQSSLRSVQPQRLRNLTATFTIDVRVCFYTHFMVYDNENPCEPCHCRRSLVKTRLTRHSGRVGAPGRELRTTCRRAQYYGLVRIVTFCGR